MSSPARIDELRKKFDENPRRYFAPLANEYRKAGDFEQAVFICQEYLPQQPGHMSGHIVYGQTLFDMGRDEEAKAVFETALTLDPENLIALKHLGDIARQAGDLDGARSWYQRVLEADPRNEEIMQVLEAIGGADLGMAARAGADTPSVADQAPVSFGEITPPDLERSGDTSYYFHDSTPSTVDTPEESQAVEELVLEQSVDAEMPVAGPEALEFAAASETTVETTAETSVPDLLDLEDFAIGGIAASSESEPESESEPATDEPPIEIEAVADAAADGFESTDDETPAEPDVELATDVILGLVDDTPVSSAEQHVPGFEVEETPARGEDLTRAIDQLEGLESFSMDAAVEPPAAASDEAATPPAPDTFATETMAELYAQQGHFDSAMEIYDQLLERSPDDAELRRRASEVERQLRGGTESPASATADEGVVGSVAVDAIGIEAGVEATSPVVAGPTIRDFFRELLNGRAVEDAIVGPSAEEELEPVGVDPSIESEGSLDILFSDVATDDADQSAATSLAQAFSAEDDDNGALRGTPAHPAADELSLDHVFRSATPAKGSGSAGAFSLDQFFAGEPGTAELSESASEAGGGGAGAQRPGDDIAQFNAWLNGLKKT